MRQDDCAEGSTSPTDQVSLEVVLALMRLVYVAENSPLGQARRVAAFLVCLEMGTAFAFDRRVMRNLDDAVGEDMRLCRDALPRGAAAAYQRVPGGHRRADEAIARCDLLAPRDSGT